MKRGTALINLRLYMARHKPVSLNLNVRGMGESATLAIKDKCRDLRRQGRQVYDFGLGQSPFPVPKPVVEALRAAASEKDYLPSKGLPALREAVGGFHHRKDRIDVDPDHILVGPGSKELMFLLMLTYYGEILLTPPCWVTYWPQARILGRRISRVHTSFESRWKISAEQLCKSLELVNDHARPRLLVLNYPSNPTGQTYSADELQALADVARQYDLIVLSDEIYGQLHFSGEHISIARYYPEGTIVSSGLSKWCGAGGWRLGTFTFPAELDWLVDAMAAVGSETYTSVSAPIQYAAVEAFNCGPEIERYLLHARRILKALGDRCTTMLAEAGLRVHRPAGAFYLFVDFSPLTDAMRERGIGSGQMMCERLLDETGVAILPGSAFGRARGELTARLAYVDFDGSATMAASERVSLEQDLPADFPDLHCGRLLEGIARLAAWSRIRS